MEDEFTDPIIVEIVNDKNSEKSETDIESFESKKELKHLQECDSDQTIVNSSDDINRKETNDPRIQAKFERSRHDNICIFIFSRVYYERPKKTVRANGNIHHLQTITESNNNRHVQNLYRDKATADMTLNKFKFPSSSCWNGNYQPLTIDMTKDKCSARYRLVGNSLFVHKALFLVLNK